jgi:hypothetical protein
MRRLKLVLLSLLMLCGLGACGGGDSGPSATASVAPASVAVTYPANNQALSAPRASVAVTFTNLPTEKLYPVVVADKAVLSGGTFSKTSSTTYQGDLVFDGALSAGSYSGILALKLCTVLVKFSRTQR